MSSPNLISETDIIQLPLFSCDVMYVTDATITGDVNIDNIVDADVESDVGGGENNIAKADGFLASLGWRA